MLHSLPSYQGLRRKPSCLCCVLALEVCVVLNISSDRLDDDRSSLHKVLLFCVERCYLSNGMMFVLAFHNVDSIVCRLSLLLQRIKHLKQGRIVPI